MTTQVVLASTAFGLATVTAAFDNGDFEPGARRILVITCNTAMPEATTPMQEIAGVPDLMRRFDAVYDYNACIEPQHPSIWHPRVGDLPLWERHFRGLWDLGADDLHLIVESIQVNPAQALCRIFGDARIDLYADGLMSYGPTRNVLPEMVASRIERLVHLDLVPGLTPLLLSERQVPHTAISTECFRAVAKTMVGDRAAFSGNDRVALIVGQYLAAVGILSEGEELDLYAAMISGCVDAGYSAIAFKPHPSVGGSQIGAAPRCRPLAWHWAGRNRRPGTGRGVLRARRSRTRCRLLLNGAVDRVALLRLAGGAPRDGIDVGPANTVPEQQPNPDHSGGCAGTGPLLAVPIRETRPPRP